MNRNLKSGTGLIVTVFAIFIAALNMRPSDILAADKMPQKINVAFSSISGNMAPLWVTQERGFFRKYGLEVQVILIESGTTTAQALVAGDISFAQVAGPAIIQSNLRGADTVIIAGVVNTLTFQLFTEQGITRPDQFKGKAVGVTRYGSATDFAMRYALDKYGLDTARDVSILQMGNVPNLLTAMEAGKIHGAMLSAPTSLRAKKLGYTMLADLQMLGLEYQHTSIATSRALIKSNPNLVLDFMRAYSEGIHFAKTHRRETINILTKYLRTDDMEILDDTYESIIRTLVPEKPYPTEKGIQIILREFGLKDAAARSAKPEQFIDLTFIKELDNSGFIDRLYKTSPVAQAAPRTHPVPAPVAIKEKIPAAEKPVKTAVLDERSRPVAKQQPEPTEKPATVQITPKPVSAGAREYTVRAGDTLSKLAERFYNSTSKWAIIYEANKETVKNPNYIYVGMKITIPAEDQTS